MTPKRYAYIDAIRGYAILLVIAVHSSQYFNDLPDTVRTLADQGARGVQLFFVASAMTLGMSWQARHDGTVPFYIRRFFRIAPMYYLSIPLFLWGRGFGPSIYAPDGIGWRHVAMAATFTHGWMPDTITSVVPGSWSIADEMMFYAVFPLLMLGLNRVRFSNRGSGSHGSHMGLPAHSTQRLCARHAYRRSAVASGMGHVSLSVVCAAAALFLVRYACIQVDG